MRKLKSFAKRCRSRNRSKNAIRRSVVLTNAKAIQSTVGNILLATIPKAVCINLDNEIPENIKELPRSCIMKNL